MRAVLLLMILFFVLFFEVDVEHLLACSTFFYVSAAVSKMSSNFALGKLLEAVIAPLKSLIVHVF